MASYIATTVTILCIMKGDARYLVILMIDLVWYDIKYKVTWKEKPQVAPLSYFTVSAKVLSHQTKALSCLF